MNDKILRKYIRELLNEYDVNIKLGSGGLPPDVVDPGAGGPDDESYRKLIKAYAYHIYSLIYAGDLIEGYDTKSGVDPSKDDVQRALDHAAEYIGESLEFYSKQHLILIELGQRVNKFLTDKISELSKKIPEIEEEMKSGYKGKLSRDYVKFKGRPGPNLKDYIRAGWIDRSDLRSVGKTKLSRAKEEIIILKMFKNGGTPLKQIVKYIKDKYDPNFKVDEKVFQNYDSIRLSAGKYWWVWGMGYIESINHLIKTGKMPNKHTITYDIIKTYKKYGDVGVNESFKKGDLYQLRKKTGIQDPEDFIELEPGARLIHNKDAYEFAITLRQLNAERDYYEDVMKDRKKRR